LAGPGSSVEGGDGELAGGASTRFHISEAVGLWTKSVLQDGELSESALDMESGRQLANRLASFGDSPQQVDIGPDDLATNIAIDILGQVRRLRPAARHVEHMTAALSATTTDPELSRRVALGAMWVIEEIGAQVARDLDDRAHRDRLTLLLNRSAYERDIGSALALPTARFLVVAVDIDGLKRVNDGPGGHAAGDEHIKLVAATIQANLGERMSLYRVGGDEFHVIAIDCSTEDIHDVFAHALAAGCPSLSWGAAQYPDEATDRKTLEGMADARMYESKRARKSGVGYRFRQILLKVDQLRQRTG
jgi:diguanylate cyclase (GGDEF)-like protein